MNQYVTSDMIKKLREAQGLTQAKLAEMLNISDKTVSKWETGRGLPDIALLEPLANALGISVTELFQGENVKNTNRSFNMTRSKFYVCPICSNVIFAAGEAVISCCGTSLPALEAEETDEAHLASVERVEDEYYISLDHDMTKAHYISFMAGVNEDGCEIKKLYPEGSCDARFKISRTKWLYYYCNRHGLYKMRIKRK